MTEWTETSPMQFEKHMDGRIIVHECGRQCREVTVKIHGVECCPISQIQMGIVISTVQYGDELEDVPYVPVKRPKMEDPLNVSGSAEHRARAEQIYRQLFQNKLVDKIPRESLKTALEEAKLQHRDITLESVKRAVLKEVQSQYITLNELEKTTQIATSMATMMPYVNFVAILLAVLMYQAEQGLAHRRQVLIAHNDKIKRLILPSRAFKTVHLDSSLITVGMNAIAESLDQLANMELLENGCVFQPANVPRTKWRMYI